MNKSEMKLLFFCKNEILAQTIRKDNKVLPASQLSASEVQASKWKLYLRSVEVIQTPEKRAINLTYFVDLSVFGKDFMVEQDGGLSLL